MPTARELLEQADALMRRNRTAAVDDIPVLTDSVPLAEAPLPVRQKMREHAEPARAAPDPIPTLTERVDSSAKVAAGSMMGEGEPSDWLDFDEPQPSIMGDAPDSIAIVPPVELAHDLDDALLESAEHEEIELKSAVEDDFDEELAKRAAVPRCGRAGTGRDVRHAPALSVIGRACGDSDCAGACRCTRACRAVAAPEPHRTRARGGSGRARA